MRRLYSKSTYFQNFLRTAILLLVCFAVFAAAFISVAYQFVISEKQRSMEKTADEVCHMMAAYSGEWDLNGFETRMTLTGTANISGYSLAVLDANGTILATSSKTVHSENIGKTVPSEVIAELNASGSYEKVTKLGDIYSDIHYVVGRVISSPKTGKPIGYVLVSESRQAAPKIWRSFSGIFGLLAFVILVTAFVVTYFRTRRQAQPLQEMAEAANRFARGETGVRVAVMGRQDEIGELADAFNSMADSLERSEMLRREFISNVSHELKTPMTTITGFAEGILDGTIPPEKQEKYLRVISSETKRLSRLVKSMLDMSQLQAMDPSEVLRKNFDVAETARLTAISLEKKVADHGLSVEMQVPEDAIPVRGDADAITQVIYNLLDNAIKFSHAGGSIKLEVWKQNKKAYVSVENHGQTIPQEELALIFDRFHKSDASRSLDKEGVGLGLYIVKTILDNHNESIFVTSHDGITRFVFTLALYE